MDGAINVSLCKTLKPCVLMSLRLAEILPVDTPTSCRSLLAAGPQMRHTRYLELADTV